MAYQDAYTYSPKKTTVAKRMLKIKQKYVRYEKTVIHISKFSVVQYLLLLDISYYLKYFLICSKFLIQKRTLLWQNKKQKTEMLKI